MLGKNTGQKFDVCIKGPRAFGLDNETTVYKFYFLNDKLDFKIKIFCPAKQL